MSKDLPILKESEILKTPSGLTAAQVQKFFSETPESKIYSRPAKGGGKWRYVEGSYVTQVLNSLFGFNWSFTVETTIDEALKTASTGTVVVKGRLVVQIGENTITKEQFGRKEVAFLSEGYGDLKKRKLDESGNPIPLDFGNDMKAAATDAKKKCATELGLFADVYSSDNFFEATITGESEDEMSKIAKAYTNASTD